MLGLLLAAFWLGTPASQTLDAVVAGAEVDAIAHRAWLDDPDGTLTPEDTLSRDWTPFQRVLGRGYTSHVTWLRLRIDPRLAGPVTLASDRRLILRIEPQQLDEVMVFRVDRPIRLLATLGDTTQPASGRPRWLIHSALIPDSTDAFEVLLRVRNRGSHIVSAKALRWDEARDQDVYLHLKAMAFLVFTLAIVLWSAFSWRSHRDSLIALFVAHQAAVLGVVAAQRGLLRFWAGDWISPSMVDHFSAALIPVYTTLVTLFHVLMIRDLGAREPERKLLLLAVAPGGLGLLILCAGFRQQGVQLAVLTAPLVMPILLVVCARCRGVVDGLPTQGTVWNRVYLVGAYAVMTALTLPQALSALGLRTNIGANFDWFMSYSLVSTLLMGGLLWMRVLQIERQRGDLSLALAEARRQEQVQSARAAEHSELVSMLVHELKTPLSVINLSLGRSASGPKIRERALRSVKAMQEVIDRCAQIARLEHAHASDEASPLLQSVDPVAAVEEVVALQTQCDRIHVDTDVPLPACTTDRQMLLLVLNNLLDNAIKYGAPDTPVKVMAQAASRRGCEGVSFCVTNVVGRAGRPDAQHLFEKYHRGAQARHRSGSGLGLYLSHRLAARLAGELSLLPDQDVRFELWLPCTPSVR